MKGTDMFGLFTGDSKLKFKSDLSYFLFNTAGDSPLSLLRHCPSEAEKRYLITAVASCRSGLLTVSTDNESGDESPGFLLSLL